MVNPYAFDSRFAPTRGTSRIIPTYHWGQDLTWNRGAHELRFGGNVTNSVRFDPRSVSLSMTAIGSFGKYTNTLNSPRQMQFALRYEF
jgi:hypothetical protein